MSHNVYGLYSTGCYIIILSEEVCLDIGYHLIRGCKQVLY